MTTIGDELRARHAAGQMQAPGDGVVAWLGDEADWHRAQRYIETNPMSWDEDEEHPGLPDPRGRAGKEGTG